MKALVLRSGTVALEEIDEPKVDTDEALIEVLCAGVCATDLELCKGYYPYEGVLGHEFVGIVRKGPSEWLGERVVGEINCGCGVCPRCRRGQGGHCKDRTVLGIVGRQGAFAEFLSLPVANLHRVPAEVKTEDAVFTEPLAAACQVLEQVALRGSMRVLVVGDGRLGQLVSRVLSISPCELHVLGRHRHKLALLAPRCAGVYESLPEKLVHEMDLVVECTGRNDGFALALSAVRPQGVLVLKSTYAGPLTLYASSLVVDEITVVGSRCGPFGTALRLLKEGRVQVADLVQVRYPLSRAKDALEHAGKPGALKVLITGTATSSGAG